MRESEAREFCARWLSAWSGNRPDVLIEFYGKDACYTDPARPEGLRGRHEIRAYFTKLLAKNPDWKWELAELFPTERGFVVRWIATIPTARGVVRVPGVDIVEVEGDRIERNDVYFDRTPLLMPRPNSV